MTKNYKVKEIYYTLQGEGFHSGASAIFCRFSGCNLWTGREEDRDKAICKFCDTDFWGMDGENGGKYTAQELVDACIDIWDNDQDDPFIVFTGGEPALQLDEELIALFKQNKFYTTVETNGTLEIPSNMDWVTISPKANTKLALESASEVKLVHPQKGIDPKMYDDFDADYFYLQPLDDEAQEDNIYTCMRYCKRNPKWRLSLQLHKILDIK